MGPILQEPAPQGARLPCSLHTRPRLEDAALCEGTRPRQTRPTPVLSLPAREAVRQGEDGAMLTGGTGESGPEQKG